MSRRERLLNQLYSVPRNPEVDERKRRFDDINAYISMRGGWMVSAPGDPAMEFQALPDSPLPGQLMAMGYIVEKIGTTERILAHAVAQRFETSSSGALVPATEGSTKPVTVTVTVTNAGIATVEQFELR
jgi:hypothetical protein